MSLWHNISGCWEVIGLDGTALDQTSDPFTVTVSPGGNSGYISIDTSSLTSTDQGSVHMLHT